MSANSTNIYELGLLSETQKLIGWFRGVRRFKARNEIDIDKFPLALGDACLKILQAASWVSKLESLDISYDANPRVPKPGFDLRQVAHMPNLRSFIMNLYDWSDWGDSDVPEDEDWRANTSSKVLNKVLKRSFRTLSKLIVRFKPQSK